MIAVVALALIGGGGVLAWGIVGLLSGGSPIGDGRDPGSYGADLSTLVVDREALAGTGNPRDFLRPYEDPDRMPGSEVALGGVAGGMGGGDRRAVAVRVGRTAA